jgi:Phage integrase family
VQPSLVDRKTGEAVHFLFTYRGMRMSTGHINRVLIPLLCRKANVPRTDARGVITGHRARSTIATQLYNAKEPMTLFELQAWLGHSSPNSTQHYARITPTTLTKAYRDAGYFERNLRAIRVLIDRNAVTAGAVDAGKPWQYFDLGHGFCTYRFFEQCQHRMACARCDFYVPKDSTQAQLLEAKTNLQRMLVEIPLTDDEQAAVEDGDAAVDRLLNRLAEMPTPAGSAPSGVDPRSLSMVLPVISQTIRASRPTPLSSCGRPGNRRDGVRPAAPGSRPTLRARSRPRAWPGPWLRTGRPRPACAARRPLSARRLAAGR